MLNDAVEVAPARDLNQFDMDEVERLIERYDAPALLWVPQSAPARQPEPFGMIA